MGFTDLTVWFLSDENPVPSTSASGDEKVALYGMIAAIAVALIYGITNTLGAKHKSEPGTAARKRTAAERKVAREHEAWERWLIYQNFDPRKIKTGYETVDEVTRDAAAE